MTQTPAERFESWKKRRWSAQTSDDAAYESYVDQALGLSAQREAGRTHSEAPGGPDPSEGMSDDVIYRRYRSELDGSAARKRAELLARQERADRRREWQQHSETAGYPAPSFYQDGA